MRRPLTREILMPIYEYRCDDCAQSFETFVRPGHPEDAACPDCAGAHIHRELSVFASGRGAESASPQAMPSARPAMGGGCCGGRCH
jgi:putative FmdB family regulatory protein